MERLQHHFLIILSPITIFVDPLQDSAKIKDKLKRNMRASVVVVSRCNVQQPNANTVGKKEIASPIFNRYCLSLFFFSIHCDALSASCSVGLLFIYNHFALSFLVFYCYSLRPWPPGFIASSKHPNTWPPLLASLV